MSSLNDSTSIMNQFLLSGKFINELGNYIQCQSNLEEYIYSLAVVYTNASIINSPKYVWGFCIQKECNKSSLVPLDNFIKSQKFYVSNANRTSVGILNLENAEIEYVLPQDDLEKEQEQLSNGFWILISILSFSALLGLLGIIVEYTKIGNVRLSHEETNFSNIDIPILQDGNMSE